MMSEASVTLLKIRLCFGNFHRKIIIKYPCPYFYHMK
jgi:hypothetical protein